MTLLSGVQNLTKIGLLISFWVIVYEIFRNMVLRKTRLKFQKLKTQWSSEFTDQSVIPGPYIIQTINFTTKLFDTLLCISQRKTVSILNFYVRVKLNTARFKTEQRWLTVARYNIGRNSNFTIILWNNFKTRFFSIINVFPPLK